MDPQEQHSNKLRILSIGSNAISAFFSWRLQASQAADVTMVWRSHFENVAQYGIAFKSEIYGSDRFRPNRVVRTVEEAAAHGAGYDYILVCIKALPDIYKLGEVIQPVVTASHTCIILNTTTAIGIEHELMEMYPRNMVLSLCSGIDLTQSGPAEFDHHGSQSVYIGALRQNPALPREVQQDMTESLTLTLEAGAVECTASENIEKCQWERLIGLIAFHPISVILKEPNHLKIMEDQHTKELVDHIFDECISICDSRKISFPYDFKARSINALISPKEAKSTMYQDFLAGRPMEIEVHLAIPIAYASESNLDVPYLKSTYALLNHINKVNQQRSSAPMSPVTNGRLVPQHTGQSSMAQSRPYIHRNLTDGAAMVNGGRAMSMVYGPPSNSNNGYSRGPPPAQPRRMPSQVTRQESLENLQEFAAVAMYGDLLPPQDGYAATGRAPVPQRVNNSQGYYPPAATKAQQPRQGALAKMGRKMGKMKLSSRGDNGADFDDDDDEEVYVDTPAAARGPPIDPEQVDMLAMTRRGRNSAMGNRLESERAASFANGRPKMRQSKSSSQYLMHDLPGVHDAINNTALFGMGDNRYGTVDTRSLVNAQERLNSMQSARHPSMLSSQQRTYPGGASIRQQNGPPNTMTNGRGPYPPDGYNRQNGPNGSMASFRGQPPMGQQQLTPHVPNYPAKVMDRNAVATRSVTGSASASFGSLGNGSGSHSSSSSRDEIPAPPPTVHR